MSPAPGTAYRILSSARSGRASLRRSARGFRAARDQPMVRGEQADNVAELDRRAALCSARPVGQGLLGVVDLARTAPAMPVSFTARYRPHGCEGSDATGERSDITGRPSGRVWLTSIKTRAPSTDTRECLSG